VIPARVAPPEKDAARLLALEDGWDTYDGRAPTEAAVHVAAAIKRNLTLVPLSSGGVQLEAHAGGVDLEIVIDPDGRLRGVACEATP